MKCSKFVKEFIGREVEVYKSMFDSGVYALFTKHGDEWFEHNEVVFPEEKDAWRWYNTQVEKCTKILEAIGR